MTNELTKSDILNAEIIYDDNTEIAYTRFEVSAKVFNHICNKLLAEYNHFGQFSNTYISLEEQIIEGIIDNIRVSCFMKGFKRMIDIEVDSKPEDLDALDYTFPNYQAANPLNWITFAHNLKTLMS